MEGCNNIKRKDASKHNNKFNINSISGLINIILSAFDYPKEPLTPLPPQLLYFGAKLRPGLSPSLIASRIIARQSEAGLVVGDVFADGPNKQEAMEVIRVEEIINSLLTEAKVEVTIPQGVLISGTAASPTGTLPVVGATSSIGVGDGILR